MDFQHVTITFEDVFSFAKEVRHTTRSLATIELMKKDIGNIVIDRYDKRNGIHYQLRLVSIEPTKF
jgi:hypothetical protein